MTIKLNINKKTMLLIIFILLIIIISVVYIATNNKDNSTNINNIGGTGGDYTPVNSVAILNSGILYDLVGESNATKILSMLKYSVLYDISISNSPDTTADYIKLSDFDYNNQKKYKDNKSYTATIDNNQINSIDNIPWNYWFSLTTDDGREFRLDINMDPEIDNNLISVKKIN